MTVNAPPGTDGWGVVPVFSGSGDNSASVLQMFIPLNLVGGERSIYRRFFRSTWTDWEPLATATPPQEFDLPLAEGWTAWKPTKYWKTQENIVTAVICIRASESHESGSKIGTLPAGFRPASNIEVPATIGSYSTGTVQIMSGGTITFWGSEVNINGFVFVEFSFVSAS